MTAPTNRASTNARLGHPSKGVTKPKNPVNESETKTALNPISYAEDYHDIIFLADILDDFERVRIANENRLRSLTSEEDWGKGVPPDEFLTQLIDTLKAQEHGVTLALKRAVRNSALGEWQQATKGVGEKTLGRFIKEVGDPAWHYAEDRPRTLAELRAYCGLHVWPAHSGIGNQRTHGGPKSGSNTHSHLENQRFSGVAPHLTRGRQANWSTKAKTRLYLIAEAMLKNRSSAFRYVYDEGRAKYADATHSVECKQCGPSGKPAPVGSDLSDGHKHARAMRLVMKAVLAEIWQAAGGAHVIVETQELNGSAPANSEVSA